MNQRRKRKKNLFAYIYMQKICFMLTILSLLPHLILILLTQKRKSRTTITMTTTADYWNEQVAKKKKGEKVEKLKFLIVWTKGKLLCTITIDWIFISQIGDNTIGICQIFMLHFATFSLVESWCKIAVKITTTVRIYSKNNGKQFVLPKQNKKKLLSSVKDEKKKT